MKSNFRYYIWPDDGSEPQRLPLNFDRNRYPQWANSRQRQVSAHFEVRGDTLRLFSASGSYLKFDAEGAVDTAALVRGGYAMMDLHQAKTASVPDLEHVREAKREAVQHRWEMAKVDIDRLMAELTGTQPVPFAKKAKNDPLRGANTEMPETLKPEAPETEKTVTFEFTLIVTDPEAMRAQALRRWLADGGTEEDFIARERSEDKFSDTPVGAWIDALFDHDRDDAKGFHLKSSTLDTNEFYQPPPLPEGFDPATSVTSEQIAKLMDVALQSEWWGEDAKATLPQQFKSLATNPVFYTDPALYEAKQPWYFEIMHRDFESSTVYKIGRPDIVAALAQLAEERPRRIIEIMTGNADADLADIFFQYVVFKEYCYYH